MPSLGQLPQSLIDTIITPIKLFRLAGMEFFDEGKNRLENYCKFITYFFFGSTFTIGVFLFTIKKDEIGADILDVANAIPCFFVMLQCFCKLSLILKKDLVRSVVYDLAELWPEQCQNQEKKELMDYWLRRNRMACDCLVTFTISATIVYSGISLVIFLATLYFDDNAPYRFAFQLYYPFEINSLWRYVMIFFSQYVSTTLVYMSSSLSCDLFLFSLTVSVSMLFRLLQYDLVNMEVAAEESLENLKQTVKRHQKILQVAEKLDEIFSTIMFTVLMFSSLTLCLFGFLCVAVEEKFQKLVHLVSLLQVLFSVFLIMLPGQILIDTSSGVAVAAYDSVWYNGDHRFKKMMYIIIARSQKPCKLQAMGYADVNFETFYKICGSSWSYLSIVNQMYEEAH